MSLVTVEGVYKDGRIELDERPSGVGSTAKVLVTFLTEKVAESAAEREKLRRQAFEDMERGLPLGGPPYPKREELYDRFDRR